MIAMAAALIPWATASGAEPGLAQTPLWIAPTVIKDRGLLVGITNEAVDKYAADRLRARQANVVGSEDPQFGVDRRQSAQLFVGGTITESWRRSRDTPSMQFNGVELEVNWRVFDPRTDEVLYETTTHGVAWRLDRGFFASDDRPLATHDGKESDESLVLQAFGDSLDRLADRPGFRAVVVSREGATAPVVAAAPSGKTLVRACPANPAVLPKELEKVASASVTVVVPGGSGSGVFLSPDGFLLSAAHVVKGASFVDVTLRKGPTLRARVIRTAPAEDVALLKIEGGGSGYPCVSVATEAVGLGAEAFVIGSPLGQALEVSVSRGIVSGRRDFEGRSFLQTDASVSPGNSGGAMLDESGALQGVVSWKVSGEAVQGLGFAVPIDTALAALKVEISGASTPDDQLVTAVTAGAAPAGPARSSDPADPRRLQRFPQEVMPYVARRERAALGVGGVVAALGVGLVAGSYAAHQGNDHKSAGALWGLHGINVLGWGTMFGGAAIGAVGLGQAQGWRRP